jgi:hypothetical protein
MIEPWADGEQRPMRWGRDQVDEEAASTLTLSPP